MANEISVSWQLSAIKGNLSETRAKNFRATLSAASPNMGAGAQSIGFAAHEAVAVGDVSTLGWAFFQNLDTTNYVELGVDVAATFYPLARLNAGESCVLRLAQGITLYAKANTAAVRLNYAILDN